MTESPLKLTAGQAEKMRSLKAMFHIKREEARRYNYMRPGSPNPMKKFERSQARANKRVEEVVMGLMSQYAAIQEISFEDLQHKIAEDPTILETVYQEALELIPKHYLPLELARDTHYFKYEPYKQGKQTGVPYVCPVD